MDITSILGVVIGAVLIVFVGIGPAKLGNFWDGASVAIVLGRTAFWRWRRRRTSLTICFLSKESC